jgi:hypothetical protein
MAVAFISNGYDTTAEKPYGEGVWADAHPAIGQATYAVRSAGDWKVSAVSGQDRTVSVAAGRGFGHGITDKTVVNDTIQLDPIASGSRWDLIACRRDWTPTSGVSQFVKVNGGGTMVIPAGRLYGPGNIDDQPLALVQVTANQTQPSKIIDLRTWAGDGGGVVANHDLVRTYMDKTGTRLVINGVDWIRRVGENDTPEWFSRGAKTFAATAWQNGAIPLSTSPDGGTVVLANIEIPDPGYPYHVNVQGQLEAVGGGGGTRWDARIDVGNQLVTLARGDVVAPWFTLNGVTPNPVTGATTVKLWIYRQFGTGAFGLTNFNRIFRVQTVPAAA